MFKNLNFKHPLKISNFKFQIIIGLFVYSFICIFLSRAYAQTSGIQVSPSIVQLDFATDKPQAILAYINHTAQPITLTLSASNNTELDNITLLQPKNAQNYQYGLASWISFSNSSLILNPGEKNTITIFIDKDKLSPGGHYGSILATIQTTSGSGNVIIKSVLAIPIFVRTHTGKEFERGEITTFSPEQNFWDFPPNFLLRFTNNGDTYLTPYGTVTISDVWGNTVGKGILNTGSLLILPQSLRRMEIPVSTFGIVWPDIYYATLSMHFGKTNQQRESTTTFFSFGTLPVVQILIVLLVVGNAYLFIKKRLS